MTPAVSKIKEKVGLAKRPVRIVFPEGWNPLVQEAAARLLGGKVTPVLLLKDKSQLTEHLKKFETIVIADYDKAELTNRLLELRKAKGMTPEAAAKTIVLPNYFGTMLVKTGLVDGYVGGIEMTTKDTVLPALQIVKTDPSAKLVSSALVMEKEGMTHVYADCSINPDPDSEQLKEIGKAAVFFAKRVLDIKDVNLAFLSYSTVGSGTGPSVDTVVHSIELAKSDPDFGAEADVEYQFDSAYDPKVRAKKAPNSTLTKGQPANVYVFPDLGSGNIGYKIAQRIGGMSATGPILTGLAAPINDLSRGASADDIEGVTYITAAQALALRKD